MSPRANQEITVNASASVPGGTTGGSTSITNYEWEWIFASDTPTFSNNGPGASSTSFTPTSDGTYILGLRVTNSCGAESQGAGMETIIVAPE